MIVILCWKGKHANEHAARCLPDHPALRSCVAGKQPACYNRSLWVAGMIAADCSERTIWSGGQNAYEYRTVSPPLGNALLRLSLCTAGERQSHEGIFHDAVSELAGRPEAEYTDTQLLTAVSAGMGGVPAVVQSPTGVQAENP